MECIECGEPAATETVVTYSTGNTEELVLCAECKAEYRDGAFVAAVRGEKPSTGGEPEQLAKCTECGELYLAQVSAENNLRPIGVDKGTCACGNAEFLPYIEN